MTSPTNSGLKKPTPHKPTTPETHSSIPSNAGRLHRASPKSEVYDPNLAPVSRPSARAFTQRSGSFSRIWMNTQRNAGIAPTRNNILQAFFDPSGLDASHKPNPNAISPAVTFPTAESDW